MGNIEDVSIDVRDVDYSWFEGVRAFLDRNYFPNKSIDQLGELDPDTGDAWLIDGPVEAKAEEIEVDSQGIPCWSIGCAQLVVRQSRPRRNQPHTANEL